MATQPPFTLDGANAKVKELYAMRDTDLQTQTKQIGADLRGWVISNFALDSKQLAYLNGIDSRFIDSAGPMIAVCMSYRLGITFIFPTEPIPTDSSKLVIVKPGPLPSYNPKDGFQIQGDLVIEIGSR